MPGHVTSNVVSRPGGSGSVTVTSPPTFRPLSGLHTAPESARIPICATSTSNPSRCPKPIAIGRGVPLCSRMRIGTGCPRFTARGMSTSSVTGSRSVGVHVLACLACSARLVVW